MRFLYLLRNIVINIKRRSSKDCTIQKQKAYIYSLPEPIDDFERSFYQYKCQKYKSSFLFNMIANLSGLFLFLLHYINIKLSSKWVNDKKKQGDAVFFANDIDKNIIPSELHKEFRTIINSNNFDAFMLTKDDKIFIKKLIRRYPFSFYYLYKCMIKISMYSAQINMYKPKAIVVYAEYSFTSSVLTAYCNYRGIEHINVMHGEKLFDIVDSFFRFDRCYVWDQFYKKLFIKLRAEKKQFIIAIPPSLKMNLEDDEYALYDYTYYLMNESKVQLNIIKDKLNILKQKGKNIAIRPHPRYSDITLVKKLFIDYIIEDPRSISIKESIKRTNTLISLYSTVLLQGYYNNKSIVIDDLSNLQSYSVLFDSEYIILSKPHKLLSEIINERYC